MSVLQEQADSILTTETKKDSHLPFLDIDIYRRPNDSLGETEFRKANDSSYLNVVLHHHLTNKHSVLSTLAQEPEFTTIRRDSMLNWIFSNKPLYKMATATRTFIVLSIHFRNSYRGSYFSALFALH
jgi:hypothetical protein